MMKILLLLFMITQSLYADKKFRITFGETVGYLKNNTIINTGEFPYIVYLNILNRRTKPITIKKCGGSIIQPNIILTAAHCIENSFSFDITVYAGIVHVTLNQNEPQIIKAKHYIVHNNYNKSYGPPRNDIAVIILKTSLNITKYVRPISLPIYENSTYSGVAVTAGWGIDETFEYSLWLKKTNQYLISNKECQYFADIINEKFKNLTETITDDMICAFNPQKSTICFGDSGGPLVYNNTLIGVTNYIWEPKILQNSKNSCSLLFPGIFARIASYLGWLRKIIKIYS